MFNAVLLAGGTGSRLAPYTNSWPKCLMPIHGIPVLEYWLAECFKNDIENIFVNTHHHAQIVRQFLSRTRFQSRIIELYEENLLGTAGTLRSVADRLSDLPTIVVHCDNWCSMGFQELIYKHEHLRPSHCPITMMTFSLTIHKAVGSWS